MLNQIDISAAASKKLFIEIFEDSFFFKTHCVISQEKLFWKDQSLVVLGSN